MNTTSPTELEEREAENFSHHASHAGAQTNAGKHTESDTPTKGTAMNPNPYPRGRWTELTMTVATKKSKNRLMSEPVSKLLQAPLRELFWGLPESRLLEEAKIRIEGAINTALAAEPLPSFEVQTELPVAV